MRHLPNVSNRLRYWWLRRIELWLRPDQRWRQKKNRSGFFPPSNVSSSRKGKGKGKVKANRKIHRVSSVVEVIISGDSVLNDFRKKEVKMDLARLIWELLWVLILNCLRQWYFKRGCCPGMWCDRNSWWSRGSADFGGCSEQRFF